MRASASCTNDAMSRPRTFACTTIRRLPFSRLIWFGPVGEAEIGDGTERQDAGIEATHVVGPERDALDRGVLVRERDRQGGQRRRILAQHVVEPHDDVEAAVALVDLPGRAPADRDRRGLVDVRDAEPVARQLLALHVDAQDRRALDLLDLEVRGPGHVRQDGADPLGASRA